MPLFGTIYFPTAPFLNTKSESICCLTRASGLVFLYNLCMVLDHAPCQYHTCYESG